MALTASRLSQCWCEPFDGHAKRKITFWSLSRFTKRSCFWLSRVAWVFLGLDFGLLYPFLMDRNPWICKYESNFAGHCISKNSKKNAACVQYFAPVFRCFPRFSANILDATVADPPSQGIGNKKQGA
jgi:hypothetical protein